VTRHVKGLAPWPDQSTVTAAVTTSADAAPTFQVACLLKGSQARAAHCESLACNPCSQAPTDSNSAGDPGISWRPQERNHAEQPPSPFTHTACKGVTTKAVPTQPTCLATWVGAPALHPITVPFAFRHGPHAAAGPLSIQQAPGLS
jgi:hypothetical protein